MPTGESPYASTCGVSDVLRVARVISRASVTHKPPNCHVSGMSIMSLIFVSSSLEVQPTVLPTDRCGIGSHMMPSLRSESFIQVTRVKT